MEKLSNLHSVACNIHDCFTYVHTVADKVSQSNIHWRAGLLLSLP